MITRIIEGRKRIRNTDCYDSQESKKMFHDSNERNKMMG